MSYYTRKAKQCLSELRNELARFIKAIVQGDSMGLITLDESVTSMYGRDRIVAVEYSEIMDEPKAYLIAITERDKKRIELDIDDTDLVHMDDLIAVSEQLEKRVAFINN